MYESFFQFHRRPFCSTPQIEFYFPAASTENSLQTLTRLVDRAEGPGLLIGSPGTGKTLVCQMLKSRFCETFAVVQFHSAQLSTHRALLQHILFALELPYRGLDESELLLALLEFLQTQGSSRTGLLLLVDEAHTLPTDVLEGLRTITNVTRDDQPRVHVILAGGPQLEDRFAHPSLSCFNQRLAARCYLQPLNYDETCGYVHWRIGKAGASADQVFAHDAWQPVYHATDGIPRLINQVCDHALLLARSAEQQRLDGRMIEQAWADLQQLPTPWQPVRPEPAETAAVIEFGGLDPEEQTQLEPIAPSIAETTLDAEEPHEMEDDVAEDLPSSPAISLRDEMVTERVEPDTRRFGPFDEPYENEETVVDRFALLSSMGAGANPTEMQQRQMAAAVQTIFQNAPPFVSPVSETVPEEPVLAESNPAELQPAEAADESCQLLEMADRHPEQSSAEVIRSLPPDDNDMIIVIDDQHGETPLRSSGGLRHRKEYRHLFSQLRRNENV